MMHIGFWYLLYIALLFFVQFRNTEWISTGHGLLGLLANERHKIDHISDTTIRQAIGTFTHKASLHRFIRKRQASGSSGGNAGGLTPTNPHQTNGLTNTTTPENSGPAGNNTNNTVPGHFTNPGNPNGEYVNCSDITTGLDNKCWTELNLSQYVQQWSNNAICLPGEGFSSCFLRQNGFPSLDCSVISTSGCPAPESDLVDQDPRKFYVVYNIYGKILRFDIKNPAEPSLQQSTPFSTRGGRPLVRAVVSPATT